MSRFHEVWFLQRALLVKESCRLKNAFPDIASDDVMQFRTPISKLLKPSLVSLPLQPRQLLVVLGFKSLDSAALWGSRQRCSGWVFPFISLVTGEAFSAGRSSFDEICI